MKYDMTTPCDACPFLDTPGNRRAFPKRRLEQFASGTFHCHKTGTVDEEDGNFVSTEGSQVCAGMLIYHEKHGTSSNFTRVMMRLGAYDPAKLNLEANVR